MLKFSALKSHSIRPLLLVMLMVGALTFSFQPTTTPDVAEAAPGDVRITGILDGNLTDGNPKAIELYVEGTVNLTGWGLYRASNGNPFQSVATLSGTFTDEFVYLVGTSGSTYPGLTAFNDTFGTSGDFGNRALESSAVSGNGNDGFRILDPDGNVIDQVWQSNNSNFYQDSYLYRDNCTGPDGANWVATNWDATENGFDHTPGNGYLSSFTTPATLRLEVPFGTWSCAAVRAPRINEFVFNHTGTDTNEFIEFYGSDATDYSNLRILGIEGDSNSTLGRIDNVITVGTTDASGYWWTGYLAQDTLENGTITLLLVDGFTGALGDDLDTDNNGTLDSTPWTSILDAIAVSDNGGGDLTYELPVLLPSTDSGTFAYGGASRIPNGTDTDATGDWLRNDFEGFGLAAFPSAVEPSDTEAINTPGTVNRTGTPPPVVTPARIYDVQENGTLAGQAGPFIIEGVVTNDLQTTLNGFYIQDVTGDGNTNTSDGIFVYDPATLLNVNAGDIVQVTGTVSETFSQTQITATSIVDTGNNGTITPVVISLPIADVANWENFEGMLITLTGNAGGVLTVTDVFNLGRFGEVTVSGNGRLFNPTNVHLPDSPQETALREENARNRLIIDDLEDGSFGDTDIAPYMPTTTDYFRNGATIPSVTGTVGYGFSNYRLRPTDVLTAASWTQVNPRTSAPTINAQLTVASFNVENYFNGNGAGGGFPTSRGATTFAEFQRQSDKIEATICAINPDIAGLVELENETDVSNVSAIETLVAELNARPGCGPFTYISTNAIGTDVIKVGIIYKPSVTPVGAFKILTKADDSRFDTDRNRPALAQTFDDAAGGRFTIVVNHLKSKNSDCGGAPDDSPNQGYCNGTRTAAAEALVDWLATDPTSSNDPDFLIVGDLNAYAQEDPIRAIEEGADDVAGNNDDYVDLVEAFVGPGNVAYSYTYFGEAGYLDHIIANGSLADQVVGVAEWHTNSDEPNDRGYDDAAPDYLYENGPFRSSDHDPVVIGLNLIPAPTTIDATLANSTIFRIGDWSDTVVTGALCANANPPSPGVAQPQLIIPFDGTVVAVSHVVQNGGEYALTIPGGTGVAPINTANDAVPVEGTTTNNGRNVARVEVISGTVCIDSFTVALNPAYALADPPTLLTSSSTVTGLTIARASCVSGVSRVVTNLSYDAGYTLHEMSVVIINRGEVFLSQFLPFNTPSSYSGTLARFGFYYWHPVPVSQTPVPGYLTGPNVGNNLQPTESDGVTPATEMLVQFRNVGTSACQTMSIEYNCGTGVANITQNSNVCIFN